MRYHYAPAFGFRIDQQCPPVIGNFALNQHQIAVIGLRGGCPVAA
jgi:hypothetical protein